MKIGKRTIKTLTARMLDPSSYVAIPNFFQVYDNPIGAILTEVLSLGSYPCSVNIKTPIDKQKVKLWSVSDFSTLNLIFCRRDYYVPNNLSTVVDIGSNIGLSSLYWLTRNNGSFVYCYEPSPISFKRLLENLKDFAGRYSAYQDAVSDFNGKAQLGLEESGVYSSLDLKTENFVECKVIHINELLEKVCSERGNIDVLKIDSEGHELRTIKAIDKSFFSYIGVINVECCGASGYIPQEFHYSVVTSAERYVRRY
jgi:FkbM family methyltransferase